LLSLARKYRPKSFADVAVQTHVSNTLRGAIARGRVAHGYLLCGPRGTGKTTLARVLAMALNCENRIENGEPLALINDGYLQHMRVGGCAGLGAKYLSREDACDVGIFGSGGMARSHVGAVVALCVLSDWLLITLGIFGLGSAIQSSSLALQGLRYGGAALMMVALVIAMRMKEPEAGIEH